MIWFYFLYDETNGIVYDKGLNNNEKNAKYIDVKEFQNDVFPAFKILHKVAHILLQNERTEKKNLYENLRERERINPTEHASGPVYISREVIESERKHKEAMDDIEYHFKRKLPVSPQDREFYFLGKLAEEGPSPFGPYEQKAIERRMIASIQESRKSDMHNSANYPKTNMSKKIQDDFPFG